MSATQERIRVGVSSCLLGERVRWNGDHKQDHYVKDVLGEYFEWVPVCPEFETGMGVPRETVRLVKTGNRVRMLGTKTAEDWTGRMEEFSRNKTAGLRDSGLSGFIFKKGSPSCGMERVPLYNGKGGAAGSGSGLFAGRFRETFPLVPVEEEGRLNDPRLRENFIVRVFAFHRLGRLLRDFSLRGLVEFHTAHKYLLMAHSVRHYQLLGRLVAEAKGKDRRSLKEDYARLFMEALAVCATPRKNANVLLHMLGYIKSGLGPEEKKDILDLIEEYRRGFVPLIVPLTLLNHYVKKLKADYLLGQVYLNPHPRELMLRNHV